MLRDFCKREAGSEIENFLQEIKKSEHGFSFEPPLDKIKDFRRLCIHKNVLYFVGSKPFGHRVRSFVSFCEEEINLPAEHISAIPAAFKLLRVLEAKPIKFSKIPSDMYQLVHLRYIALSFTLAILPSVLSKLWNIQALVVETTSRTLEIKADIWTMKQLRHLKTNASASLPKPGKITKGGKEGDKLQSLGTISPQSCTEDILDKARFLKKLGIRGRLAILLEGKTGSTSFENLWKLDNLEKLKLLNDVFPYPPSEGKLRGLPSPYRFPPKLRSLTLSDTFLDWNFMSTLGLLHNLEVLKLKEKAFMGHKWEVSEGGFLHLEVLHIGRTDLASWDASARHFPSLKRLELSNCEELMEVPIALADIPCFRMLDLHRTKLAAKSARSIEEAKKKMQDSNASHINAFKLTIFPPDES